MSDQWQFNEEDAWVEEERTPAGGNSPPEDALEGHDEDGIVTVYVTPDGQVLSTTLASNWKESVNPHELPQRIVAAANAATMRLLSRQLERTGLQESVEGTPPKQAGPDEADGPPISVDDALRMIDAVSADLERFNERIAEVANQTVTVDSAGGHVQGTGQQGQVVDVSVDAAWAGRSRNGEIENEITDVLGSLRSQTSASELTNGPQSDSISQLMTLASNPQTLLRRLGLTQ